MSGTPSMELSAEDKAYFETGGEPAAGKPEPEAGSEVEIEASEPETGKSDAEEGKKADKPADDAPKMVQKGALDAERAARKRAEKEAKRIEAEYRDRHARLEERLSILTSAMAPEPKQETAPAWDEDPIAAGKHTQAQIDQFRQEQARQRQAQEQAQRQQAAVGQLKSAYMADAAQFRETTPDFNDAYQFLVQARMRELGKLPGLRGNPMAIQKAAEDDELRIVHATLRAGESAAELMYQLAQERGWKPKSEAEKPSPQKENAAAEIERLAKAQDASTSLSKGGGGAGGSGNITLEALDRMSKDEFARFIASKNKNNPRGFDNWMEKQMVGGR